MANSHELDKTISELKYQVTKFKSISEVYSEISTMRADLIKLSEQSNTNVEKIKNVTDKFENKLAVYEELFIEFSKESKSFQRELEQHLASKLEKHNSDIQVEIRNEGSQIQRGFENALNLNFNNFQTKIQEAFSKQGRQIYLLKLLTIAVTFLCIGLGLKLFIYK